MPVLQDPSLNNLATALRAGARGTADLAGYDEQFADATARGRPTTQMDKYGQVSGLSVLADVMGQSRSRKDLRELAPQRAAARTAVADNANAQGLYNAKIAANKVTQDQTNFNTTSALTQARDAQNVISSNRNYAQSVSQEEARVNELAVKTEAQDKEFVIKNSELVDMVRTDGSPDTMQAYVFGGKAYDGDGNPLAPELWKQRERLASGRSGSRFEIKKMKDARGNEVWMQHDKQSGVNTPMSFVDGVKYTDEGSLARGGRKITQKGAEEYAKSESKYSVKRQGELMAANKDNNKTLNSIDQAINALKADAGSGPIESLLPSFRESSIALDNARENLALTQIGQFTFGSLSEAEGNWLRGSVMPHLDEDELLPYMEHRKEATLRIMEASEYEREALAAGEKVDEELLNHILRNGGFSLEEYGYKN